MKPKGGYVYIVSNPRRTVLYIGVTNNLYKRTYKHKHDEGSSFTRKYNCTDLLFFEFYDHIESAILKEKQLKKWNRIWKLDLIKTQNPEMKDLFEEVEDFQ